MKDLKPQNECRVLASREQSLINLTDRVTQFRKKVNSHTDVTGKVTKVCSHVKSVLSSPTDGRALSLCQIKRWWINNKTLPHFRPVPGRHHLASPWHLALCSQRPGESIASSWTKRRKRWVSNWSARYIMQCFMTWNPTYNMYNCMTSDKP